MTVLLDQVEVVVVQAEDWAGLYVDGKLQYENHAVSTQELAQVVGKRSMLLSYRQCTSAWDVNVLCALGRMPQDLADVELR